MKIAINAIPYTSWQGIEVFLSGLLNSWPISSDTVIIFANHKSADFLRPLPEHIQIKIINFKKLNRLNLFIYQQIIFPFVLKREKIDLLFCPSLISPWLFTKKIITIHDAAPFVLKEENSFLGKLFWSTNLFFGKLFSKKIVTVSEFSKTELIEKLNIKPEKIKVIYNGSPNIKNIAEEVNCAWQKINYIMAIGNARPRKNLESLFKAFSILHQEIKDIKLVIIGKKDKRMEEIEQSFKSFDESIIFTGFVSENEKKSIIKNSKALIFPSLYEGFGLPILEGNILGTPIVCSDIPSFKEVAENSALFFDPKNEKDIAQKIRQVLQSEDLSNNLINNGKANADKFSWENSAKSLFELIHQYENPTNK